MTVLANIVVIQPGAGPEEPARTATGDTAVLISDAPAAPVCVESLDNGGRSYQIPSRGARGDDANAILRVIRRIPARGGRAFTPADCVTVNLSGRHYRALALLVRNNINELSTIVLASRT